MDIIKTANYYKTLSKDDLCSCDYCRTYYKNVKAAYPELSDYLAGMGVDIEKPLETMPYEPYEGTYEYAAQYIVMGNASGFSSEDVNGVQIYIEKLHPMTGIDEEHFVIEIYPIRLKRTV